MSITLVSNDTNTNKEQHSLNDQAAIVSVLGIARTEILGLLGKIVHASAWDITAPYIDGHWINVAVAV